MNSGAAFFVPGEVLNILAPDLEGHVIRAEVIDNRPYHLEGTLPSDYCADPYPAELICYNLGIPNIEPHYMIWIAEYCGMSVESKKMQEVLSMQTE